MQRLKDSIARMLEAETEDVKFSVLRILTSQAYGLILDSSYSGTLKLLRHLRDHVGMTNLPDASTGKGLWDQIKSTHDLFPQRDPEDELARKRRELMLLNYAEESTPSTTLSLRRIIKKEQLEDDLSVNDDDFLSLVDITSIGGSQNIVIAKEPVKPPSRITV